MGFTAAQHKDWGEYTHYAKCCDLHPQVHVYPLAFACQNKFVNIKTFKNPDEAFDDAPVDMVDLDEEDTESDVENESDLEEEL